jgi:predicted membrane protein
MILGLVILVLGILLTLDNLQILDSEQVFRLWPLLLVAWGAALILGSGGMLRKLLGVLIGVAGVAVLLGNLGLVEFDFFDLWPLLLVFLGLAILFGARTGGRGVWGTGSSTDCYVRRWVALGGLAQKNDTEDFQGGELTTVMGGIELDLRGALMDREEAVVEVFALMGAIELKVPNDWTVISDVVAFMGAAEDKTARPVEVPDAPPRRLILKGFVVMGGIEVGH